MSRKIVLILFTALCLMWPSRGRAESADSSPCFGMVTWPGLELLCDTTSACSTKGCAKGWGYYDFGPGIGSCNYEWCQCDNILSTEITCCHVVLRFGEGGAIAASAKGGCGSDCTASGCGLTGGTLLRGVCR